jgi:hypothetical protein
VVVIDMIHLIELLVGMLFLFVKKYKRTKMFVKDVCRKET